MRQFAREHLSEIDRAFEAQRPWWFVLARKIAPMWDMERILARPLASWKARMKPGDDKYRHTCEKIMARMARGICKAYHEAGRT